MYLICNISNRQFNKIKKKIIIQVDNFMKLIKIVKMVIQEYFVNILLWESH